MPEEKEELIIEVKTNAAAAAKDVKKLSDAVNDLGDNQQQEAQKEDQANRQREKSAQSLRRLLEAMLSQLKDIHSTLGDVASSSERTAATAERAFKKTMAINRALRKEKSLAGREERQRQIEAREDFKAEQSRNQDRLRTLKLLAVGGGIVGAAKMFFHAAFESASRGMGLLNTQATTGVAPEYTRALGRMLRERGGSDSDAASAIGAISQKLFGYQGGYANLSALEQKYLSNAPWHGSPEQFMEYLAQLFPTLTPQAAQAVGGSLSFSQQLIAALRESGGAESWRKLMQEAQAKTPADEKHAGDTQKFQQDVKDGVKSIGTDASAIVSWIYRHTSSEDRRAAAKGGAIWGPTGAALSALGFLGKTAPVAKALWPIWLGSLAGYIIMKEGQKGPENQIPGPSITRPTGQQEREWYEYFQKNHKLKPRPVSELPKPPLLPKLPDLSFYFRRFNDMTNNELNFMSGRELYALNHGGGAGDNGVFGGGNSLNIENINITTRDDPQSVATAVQNGINIGMLELLDRQGSGVYVV